MIFTASDVSSLATSLERWEWAEYAACALVALGCTGEYIAEFTDLWTGGLKDRKDRIAKRSTLLLISALALELVCLVKTNSISGMLIGSLSEKASAAEVKARSASEKSALAESKAGEALTDSKAAKDAAGKAQENVGAVDKRAGEIDAQLGMTQSLLSARTIQNRDELADKIKLQFKGRNVVTRSYIGDQEGWGLCTEFWYVAKSAEMNPVNQCGMAQLEVPLTSPFAVSGPDVNESQRLGELINRVGKVGGWSAIKAPVLTIFVGAKSVFSIGQARGVTVPTKKRTNKQSAKP
jgi:hypothetical protein